MLSEKVSPSEWERFGAETWWSWWHSFSWLCALIKNSSLRVIFGNISSRSFPTKTFLFVFFRFELFREISLNVQLLTSSWVFISGVISSASSSLKPARYWFSLEFEKTFRSYFQSMPSWPRTTIRENKMLIEKFSTSSPPKKIEFRTFKVDFEGI